MNMEKVILENLLLNKLRQIRDLATNTKTKKQFVSKLDKIVKEKVEG